MNELDKALARLKDLGATPQEMDEYTREFMASKTAPADATSALQRERPNPTGDWEAIPDGLKTAAGIGASMLLPIPAGAAGVAAARGLARVPGVARAGKAAVAGLDKVPLVNTLTRVPRAVHRSWKASRPPPTASKGLPKLDDILTEAAETSVPRTIEEALEQAAPRIGDVVRNASPVKQRGAPKAQFDYFAERMAQRAAKQAEGAAEPALEDLLALSLDHIKKGGSMKSASDALKLVRRQ